MSNISQNIPNIAAPNVRNLVLQSDGLFTRYWQIFLANLAAVAGQDFPVVVAFGTTSGLTGDPTDPIATTATPNEQAIYEVSGHICISALTGGTVALVVEFTDENGNAQIVNIPVTQFATANQANAVGPWMGAVLTIATNTASTVSVTTQGLSFVGVYDASATIKKVG